MNQYLTNLKAFLVGLTRLGELTYKGGWNRWTFLPLYATDYFLKVLVGGAVVSLSRGFYEGRSYPFFKFLDRALSHIDDDHGAESGPALWGTVDALSPRNQVKVALSILLAVIIGGWL